MTQLLRNVALLLFLAASAPLFSQPCDCLTTGNCPVSITDNGTFQGTLDVTVSGPNDLGQCPLTSLCFSITHTWVGDLSATLTSPSGVNYLVMADANNDFGGCGTDDDNINVCIFPGNFNPLTNNTEYPCNTGPCPSGTCCLNGTWTMPCNGVTDPVSGATQAPTCDLDDFNVPGNPANGTWTMTINDICGADVGTLDNFSLTFACGTSSCVVCEADGGLLNADDVEACIGDSDLNLSLPPTYTGAPPNPSEYDYGYAISQNGTILSVNPTANMSAQPPGTYTLCGLSYLTANTGATQTLVGMNLQTAIDLLDSPTAPFCGDFSDDCIQVIIGPAIPPTFLDTTVCLGSCVTIGGQQICTSGTITLQSWLGCDSNIIVTLIPIFIQPGTADTTLCDGDCIILNGSQFCAPGAFPITYQSWQGCDSIVVWSLNALITLAVINPNPPPPLSCANPMIVLDGTLSFPSTVDFQWSGPNGPISQDPAISVTQPGTYTLTVINNGIFPPCTDQVSVTVTGGQSIPDLQLNGPPPSICQGESFNLSTLDIEDLNNTNPVITFHSGTPATPANQLPSPTVSPAATTTYYILGNSSGCTDQISVTLTVYPVPPPTVLNAFVCQGDCITVGSQQVCQSGPVTLVNWQGCDSVVNVNLIPIIIPPSSVNITVCEGDCVSINNQTYCPPGPHTLVYQSYQGCDSTVTYVFNEQVTTAVITPANPQPISCSNPNVVLDGSSSLPSGATLLWSGPSGPLGSAPSIVVTTAGTYTLTVTNNNVTPPCTASTSVTVTGVVEGPDLQVNGPPPTICAGESFDLATLSIVDLNNTDPIITFHSGSPATPANELPSTVVSPTATTTYYILGTTGNCSDEVPVTVNVNPIPTADFTVTSPICLDGTATVTYTGSAGPGAIFNWNFGGGTATPGTGPGPHTVEWATGGPKTITLLVVENGCTSTSSSQTVQVDMPLAPPIINCAPTTTDILFTWNDVPGATSYNVTVPSGQSGTFVPPTGYQVSGLTPGEMVTVVVEAVSGNACGNVAAQLTCTAQDCPPVTVTIDPVDEICLDGSTAPILLVASQTGGAGGGTFVFSGPGVSPANGTFDPAAANPGDNTVQVSYTEGTCTYNASITITVNPQPTATFTATSPICEANSATVNYTGTASSGAIFTWDFAGGTANPGTGPGPHTVTWPGNGSYTISLQVIENSCPSETSSQTVQVDAIIPEPDVNCVSSTSSVEFFWTNVPGATSYTVTVLAGSSGTMTSDTSMLFDGLSPNDIIAIEITAVGTGACGSTVIEADCEATICPPVDIDIAAVAPICLDANAAPFDLSIEITGGSGLGTTTVSGSGIVDPVGTFDPSAANIGANQITVTYEEGNCSYTEDITITVVALPVNGFTAVSPICETNTTSVNFTGNVMPNLVFNWDFGGGTAVPGTGQGPHTVTWPSSGPQDISLVLVNAQGCESPPVTQTVQVEEPLLAPVISCSSTTSTIEFSWPDVAGAMSYSVTVISGAAGVLDLVNNTYTITGLSPDDEVVIELTVTGGGACPPVVVTENCFAIDCPPVAIDIEPVAPICLSITVPTQLQATPAGGTWSGPGIIDAVNGIFDPQPAGIGTHEIFYVYENGNCSYNASFFIEIFGEPSADFTLTPTICVTDAATVTYTGNAAATAIYTWDFAGGNSTPTGSGPGPFAVTWPTVGNYTVSLSVEQDGCASQTFTQDVQVDAELVAPVVGCDVTTSSVEFSWPDVPGATDFEVSVISGAAGSQVSNSYTVNGLVPGNEICIELTVSGPTACGQVSVQACCTANDCPPVSLQLDPVGPICLEANSPTVNLTATATGGSGAGSGTWSGPGVSGVASTFSPNTAGTGTHVLTFVYQENANCTYTETITVSIVPPPVAEAGTDSELTCDPDEQDAELGGNSSAGVNISYLWTAATGSFPGDSTVLNPVVSQTGIYTLTVTNTLLGCSSTDVVAVTASQDVPNLALVVQPVSCFGESDGAITVTGVTGGQPPYLYSFNGSTFNDGNSFQGLPPGVYEISVLDANGCENTVTLDIQQPQEVNVELVVFVDGENIIHFGDAVEMAGEIGIPEDSLELIQWQPADMVDCDTCLHVTSQPITQTTFSITVEDNGCADSDAVTIFVQKDRPVYVPNAFSPNGDATNDVFMIYAGEEVVIIKSFLVFDRWGETVHQYFNFPPNDPMFGWNGMHRGKVMNPAVFTWFAEVEFIDGGTELIEGDVTLTR